MKDITGTVQDFPDLSLHEHVQIHRVSVGVVQCQTDSKMGHSDTADSDMTGESYGEQNWKGGITVQPNERWWKPELFPKVLPLCFLDFQSQNSFFRMNNFPFGGTRKLSTWMENGERGTFINDKLPTLLYHIVPCDLKFINLIVSFFPLSAENVDVLKLTVVPFRTCWQIY